MRMGTRVYVGKLPYDVRERDLEKFFKGYGRVREILMKEGFAFVEFEDYRDADDAVYDLNGKDLMGERVHVEFAREQRGPRGGRFGGGRYSRYEGGRSGRSGYRSGAHYAEKYGPPRNTEHRVIVENLSSRVSWQDLKDFMRQAGEVTYADAHKRERNMGIVDFNSYSDMKNAIEKLDGSEMHGRRIRLIEDKTRGSRRRSRSKSRRSHSRSHSRSRSRSRRSYSRSRSRSRSKESERNGDRKASRSRSRSRAKSRSRSVDRKSRSRSRSYERRPRSYEKNNRSRSRSIDRKSKSKSPDRSRSKSPARKASSRSRSTSPRSKDVDMNGT